MPEDLKNHVLEITSDLNVSVETDALRGSFPEYFDEEKPYNWDERDNLVAYLEFDSFPEEIFREFIEHKKLEIKKQRYYNAGDGSIPYPISNDVVINNDDEFEYGWEEFHRMLWDGGLSHSKFAKVSGKGYFKNMERKFRIRLS